MGSEKEEKIVEVDYAALLSGIASTCLLFNSRAALGKHIDFNLEQNSPSKMTNFRQRSAFHELASEVDKRYYGKCDLEEVLKEYEATSAFFTRNFKRSFAVDLHDTASNGFERKKEQIFWLLDYAYGEDDKDADWQRLSFLGKKQQLCADFYGEKCLSRNISLPILLLLLLGLLPSYVAPNGQAKNLLEDFRLLMGFLRAYSARKAGVLADAPILSRFEKELKDKIAKLEKKGEKDANNALSRLDLIHQTEMFFFVYSNYSSAENTARSNRYLDTFFEDLDGIWVENVDDTDFWQFEEIESGYFFHHYSKVRKNGNYCLEHARYECQLIKDDVGPVAYIVHPSYFRSLVEKGNCKNLHMWATIEWKKDTEGGINGIVLTPTIYQGGWFKPRSFFRQEDDAVYAENLKSMPVVEAFADDIYWMEISLCAITNDAIYLKIPEYACNDLDEKGRFLMVPKALDATLEDVRIGDSVGLSRFQDGTLYFAIPNGMVYYKVNSKEERDDLGIVVCNQILSDLEEL